MVAFLEEQQAMTNAAQTQAQEASLLDHSTLMWGKAAPSVLLCVLQEIELLLAQVTKDQAQAEAVRQVVSVEEQEVKAKAAQTQALADDAKADLDEALPALQAAVDSLSSLNKSDIVEIKSMLKPPPLVVMTLEVRTSQYVLNLTMCVAKTHMWYMTTSREQSVSKCSFISC